MEITRLEDFLPYWENIRRRTERVAERIPPERIDWSHRPEKFTLGDLVRHLGAIERWMFAETVSGRPSRYPGHGRELAEGHDAVLDYLRSCHEEAMEVFRGLSEEDLRRKCQTPAGIAITTWKWLRAMVEHEVHHRAQIYTCLGLLEIPTPPLYGLTAEQVFDNSVQDPE